ncbi:MAG: class II aldolase/adducin family protein [Oscillospiraceae bacterium]|nr:class II aldolase/adducin family protein [Oscillospiraceae bacterium]
MYENIQQEIINAGLKLDKYGLIALSGGNVSVRLENGDILITPSGMEYETMSVEDIVVMNAEGRVIEGRRKPSSDTPAILYIFSHRKDVNAVIHTHQPYATAIGLVEDCFHINLTTLANCTGGDVRVSPYSSPGSVYMGIDTVEHIGDSLAIILANHGVITIGSTLKQALYAAVYTEEAAKCYLAAKATGLPMKQMSPSQIQQAIDVFKYYGQDTPTIPTALVERL